MTAKDLHALKGALGMTWKELAKATGYHYNMLWKMGAGHRRITARAEIALKKLQKP